MTRLWKMELSKLLNIFIILLIYLNNTFTLMNATDPDENWNNESFTNESFTGGILRLRDNIIPKHYRIELELIVEEDMFHGTSSISIIINNATNIIYLHSENLTIIRPTLTENNPKRIEHVAHSFLYNEQMENVALYFEYELSPGNYTLNMDFMGIIDNNVGGFFKTSYINEKGIEEWFVATHTWPARTRRVFPCWDEPRLKAKFTITIRHHVNYTAISNTPTLPLVIKNNIAVTRFVTTPAIPTYLIVIMLCKLPSIALRNINWWGRQQLIENQTFAHSVIRNVTQYYENDWKQLKKFPILQHVAIPDLLDDGMPKWGLIFYRDQDIIYNEKLDPIARKMEVAYSIGRKISRQWLSTIVSPLWWSYLWLNEGIATFFYGADIVDKAIYPHISDLFVVQILQESLHLDQLIMNPLTSEIKSTSDINSLFSFSYFIKAPAIIRMLQHVLGDKVFRNGINRYLKRQSASLDDFWTDMRAAHHDESIESEKFNIRNMMDPWMKHNNYPILLVVQYSNSPQLGIMNILPQNALDNWMIPVTYTTQTHLNFNNTLPNIWLKSGNLFRGHFFNLSSENDWIIFNLQQTGYYRVRYNNENWLKIAQYLNSENYTKIHVLNRAQIIDDAFHFMISDQLDSSTFWKLISYLSRETDYTVWYPMFKAIEYMSYIFPFRENEYFKTIILNQLNPLLRKIGYEENPSDTYYTKCLRQEAAKWACVLDDRECKRQAVVKFEWHLANHTHNKLLPWWTKWTYCNALSAEDDLILKKIFNIYVDEFLEEKDTTKLEFLACSNKYFHIVSTFVGLKSRFHNERFLKRLNKDYISFFHYTVERHAKNEFLLDYMLANWKEVKPKEISTTVALIDIINHVYSSEQLDKIMEFMKSMKMVSLIVDHEYLNIEFSFNRKKIHGLINENFVKLLISKVQNKVDIRLSEIKKHVNSYMYT